MDFDDIRKTVRGEQAGAFSVQRCMEWLGEYERRLAAAEAEVAAARKDATSIQRDAIGECVRICEAYYDELRGASTRERVHRSACVGADEEAVDGCASRLRALLGGR